MYKKTALAKLSAEEVVSITQKVVHIRRQCSDILNKQGRRMLTLDSATTGFLKDSFTLLSFV